MFGRVSFDLIFKLKLIKKSHTNTKPTKLNKNIMKKLLLNHLKP